MKTKNNLLLKVYLLRHPESVKGVDGSREYDAPLTEAGKTQAKEIAKYISYLGQIDQVISGNLQRHTETANILVPERTVALDSRLNAVKRARFLESPAAEIAERDYHLHKFQPNQDEIYQGFDAQGNPIAFNPDSLGIFPFDKFVCRAHLNRKLRDMIFPEDRTLEDVIRDVVSFHEDMIQYAREGKRQIVAIGSGSSNEHFSEFAQYGTVGEHILVEVSAASLNPIDWKARISKRFCSFAISSYSWN